jgi:hypothetical protein
MARMGFTKASSFVVRVGHVPMEPAARLATSHANCAAADRGEPTPADRAAPGRTHASSAATLALRLARARDAGLGDDAAAASLGTHEERDCCFRVARLVRREATMAATRSLVWPLRSLARDRCRTSSPRSCGTTGGSSSAVVAARRAEAPQDRGDPSPAADARLFRGLDDDG